MISVLMCFGCEISDPTVAKVLVTWHSEPPQAVHFWLLRMRPSQEEEQMVVEACGFDLIICCFKSILAKTLG